MFFRFFCVSIFIAFISVTNAFVQTPLNFRAMKNNHVERIRPTQLRMGGNNAQFGIFSPAVYVAKVVLGDAKLNKIRGKAIALHSQAITEWCLQYGAYNLRLKLIKKAKKNGDRLGFLV